MKPLLCYIGIHRYKDKIELSTVKDTRGVPFKSTETCKCGKIRYSISGFIGLPERSKERKNNGR